jgi:hypothetical protein
VGRPSTKEVLFACQHSSCTKTYKSITDLENHAATEVIYCSLKLRFIHTNAFFN